jgi:hypothetical protein
VIEFTAATADYLKETKDAGDSANVPQPFRPFFFGGIAFGTNVFL